MADTTGYDRSKYEVFKGDEYDRVMMEAPSYVHQPTSLDPDTYFVLRSGDLGSRLALGAYKEGLLLELDLLPPESTARIHLMALVDDVAEMIDRWSKVDRKIPD